MKAATKINRAAADESRQIQKILVLRVQDLVRDQNLKAALEAVRVHIPHHDHDLALHLDPSLEASPDPEAALYPDQDRDLSKVDHDQDRAREKAAHDQDPIAVRGRADQKQDQDQNRAREKAALGLDHRVVREKPYLDRGQDQNQNRDLNLGLDLEVAHAQARSNEVKVDHDQSRNPFRDLNQDLKVPADHDRALDPRVVLEAGVPADRHGKDSFTYHN